ncbi:MAG: hypothetical protein OD918_06540 [Gammaproteobacteria bacterium]
MPTETFKIKTDERYFRQNRSYAISDVYDALVEIITNCDDSYHRLFKNSGRQKDGGDILIEIERHRSKPSRISVSDKAEGLTRADMRNKLGRRGKRTSEPGDRGFMARGIKDCVELGVVTVQSIVDGTYCSCLLTPDNNIALENEKPADSELRKNLGIYKNGTVVTLECSESIPQVLTLERDLSSHYALRDILAKSSDANVRIRNGRNGQLKPIHSSQALYSGNPVYREKFTIDGCPESVCDLTIWKHAKPLSYKEPRLRESGILVKSERAIYLCSLFGYENEAKHYSGRMICPYIDLLLEKYDTGEEKTLLVDPARKQGLNRDHRVTKNLTEKIEAVLCGLLEKDKAEKEQKSGNIATAEMRRRLDALAQMADKLWKDEFDSGDLSDVEGRALDAAEYEGAYILPPRFKIKVGEERSLTVYVKESIYDKNRKVRVESSHSKILQVVKQFDSNEKLRPHMKREGIFYGNIKVAGRSLGESTITVRPSKTVAIEAFGEVVEHGNSGDVHVFPEGASLEFERKNYIVVEGKEKSLKIFSKKMQRQHQQDVVNVSSNKPSYVEVLGGHKFQLESTSNQYVVVEVRVEGRSITEHNQPATITAKMGEKTAKTTVRVVEKKYSAGRFSFELTSEDLGHYRARWEVTEETKQNFLLKISAVHPSISRYFGDGPDFPGQEKSDARALIAELVTEAICIEVLRKDMELRAGGYKFANVSPGDALNTIVDQLQRKIHEFSIKAHKVMFSG